MTPEDFKNLTDSMKEELVLTMKAMMPEMQKTVEKQIEITVNGKINGLRTVVDEHVKATGEHRKHMDAFIEEMKPYKDGLTFMRILRVFVVWASGFIVAMAVTWGAFVTLPELFAKFF